MKKIPYGISDYRKLKEQNYLYVDKTMYLSILEEIGGSLIYLRPGRFGKSLFTSMLYYYYDVNSESLFEPLYKDTYVYNNKTPNKNNYYILKFDFSGITTNVGTYEDLEKRFKVSVIVGINEFTKYYAIDYKINEEENVESLLKRFLSEIKTLNLKHKIYILIDEYDNFTNGILEGDATLFKDVVSMNGFIKSFYAVIKEYIGLGVIDRFFATGICPITLNSMTSGFNIAKDISTNIEFNSMVGLTHEEIRTLLNEYEEKDKLYEIMLENYDGYLFNKNLSKENRTFNATLVMYFLDNYGRYKKIPEVLYDNNITVNYGKIENLIKLQNNNFWQSLISEILTTNEISGSLLTSFNLNIDFDYNDIVSLLYYFGYLTIKGADDLDIVFRVPNEMMKITYNNYFIKLLKDNDIVLNLERTKECIREIAEFGTINKITEYVSEILESTSNRMFMKFDEKYIQLLYYTILRNTLKFNTYVEQESNLKYIDIYIEGNKEYMSDNLAIELKYIKKGEYESVESLLEKKKQEGTNQLKEYSEDKRLNITKRYLVVFVGSEVKLLERVE